MNVTLNAQPNAIPQLAWNLIVGGVSVASYAGATVKSLKTLTMVLGNQLAVSTRVSGAGFAVSHDQLRRINQDLDRAAIVPELLITRAREIVQRLGGTLEAFEITTKSL